MLSDKWKLIVIGLDGVDWSLAQEFIKEGKLKNLKKFCEQGVGLKLKSTVPPISPVAWTTLLSGLDPGKHGIYDWARRQEENYEFRILDSRDITVPMCWDILAAQKLQTSVLNLPLTYPPKKINGSLVCGILTPHEGVDFTYPAELAQELRGLSYRIGVQQAYSSDSEELYYQDLVSVIESRMKAIKYLLEKHPADIGIFLVSETDFTHHKFWKYRNASNKQTSTMPVNPIFEIYKKIDLFLGDIFENADKNTNIVVLSDHGFGNLKKVFYVNAWLREKGFLKVKSNRSVELRNKIDGCISAPGLLNFAKKVGLSRLLSLVPKRIRDYLVKGAMSFSDIDWQYTQAYSNGLMNQIYINLKGREPEGSVDPSQKNEVLGKIENELRQLIDPSSGEKMAVECIRAEDVYHGTNLKMAPELHFILDDYNYISTRKLAFHSKEIFADSEYQDSGTHRPNGIFFAKGPNVTKAGCASVDAQINIIDVLPTLLYIAGAQIPQHLDGKINEVVVGKNKLTEEPPRYFNMQVEEKSKEECDVSRSKVVEDRLRNLGYFD